MKPLCIVSCPIDTFSGYGARSRDFVNSLIKSKDKEWDIQIIPQKWGNTPWNFLSKDNPLRKRFIHSMQQKPDVWIQVTIPEEFQPIGHFNIGVTAGIETTAYPAEWINGNNRMDLTLISSTQSKDVCLSTTYDKIDNNTKQKIGELKTEKPVEVLFEGLDTDKYFKIQKFNLSKSLLKSIPEEFCFLFTGHWLPGEFGEDRKDVATLIKSFLITFKGSGKKPALILKTNQVNYSILDEQHIIELIQKIIKQIEGENLPNIYLLHGELTDEEMNLLNNDPKVKSFVSFTKGEGFGRPLLEAAITGKPVITSNWGGHLDFIKPDYNILIGGQMKTVHPTSANKWILKDAQWFFIDHSIAGRAMKDVYKKYKTYIKKSRKQTQYLKDNFSLNKMTELLGKFLPKLKAAPKHMDLKLPKLKKVTKEQTPPSLNLPKLKKINV